MEPQKTESVRYAVVGAGWISQAAFLPAIPQVGNACVTAIVSGHADHAAKLAAFYDIGHVFSYDDFDRMLASDICDAVYIALPNSMHADYSIRAMQAGKHALVEKPLALTVEECEAMIAASQANNVLLMTAYRLHSEPGTVKVLDLIRAGEIGDPRHFASTFSLQSDADNHRLLSRHWGGPLQDIGIYCLNAARHAFGSEPIEALAVSTPGNGDPRFGEVDAALGVTLTFPGGRLAQFLCSFEANDTDSYRIIGTEGEITVEHGFDFRLTPRVWLTQGRDRREIDIPETDHFGGMTEYFSHCILTGTQPIPDGGEGLADIAALRAIEAAAKTGMAQPIVTPARDNHPSEHTLRIVPRTERRLVF